MYTIKQPDPENPKGPPLRERPAMQEDYNRWTEDLSKCVTAQAKVIADLCKRIADLESRRTP